MLSSKHDPKTKEDSVEETLSDVTKKKHPGGIKHDGDVFNGKVEKNHRESKSKTSS